MKLVYGLGLAAGLVGRPFTGAWIETCLPSGAAKSTVRRPFTGAWIETCPTG